MDKDCADQKHGKQESWLVEDNTLQTLHSSKGFPVCTVLMVTVLLSAVIRA